VLLLTGVVIVRAGEPRGPSDPPEPVRTAAVARQAR
jgi:hypothetical protein